MTVRLLLVAAILMIGQPVLAQIVTKIDAIETTPANIILPATTDGMMTFRPCDGDCDVDYKRVRLTALTKFTVNGKAVKYEDFRRDFANIKRRPTSYALVSYETETNTATSIQLAN